MTRKAEVGIVRTHNKHRPECLELVCAQNTLNVVAYQIGLKVFVDIGVEDCGLLGEFYYRKSLRIRYYFSCQAESLAGDILIQINNDFPRSGATLHRTEL